MNNNKYEIITICGSVSRFRNEMFNCANELEKQGYIVLLPSIYITRRAEMTTDEANRLQKLHEAKILISKSILVYNRFGYIGESTQHEIEFAKAHEKIVWYYCSANVPMDEPTLFDTNHPFYA